MKETIEAISLGPLQALADEVQDAIEARFTFGRLVQRCSLPGPREECFSFCFLEGEDSLFRFDIRGMYAAKLGYALAVSIEADRETGITRLSRDVPAQYGMLGVEPTEDVVSAAIRHIAQQAKPLRGAFFWHSPSAHIAMLKNPNPMFFQRPDVAAPRKDDALQASYVGTLLHTIPCHKSSLTNIGFPNQSYSWMAHPDSIALDVGRVVVGAIRASDDEPTASGPLSDKVRQALLDSRAALRNEDDMVTVAVVSYACRLQDPDGVVLMAGD